MRAAMVLLLVMGCSGFKNAGGGGPDLGGPTALAEGLVLPVSLAVDDRDVYWLEFGPQNQGLCGMLTRVDKQRGCAQADAGCVDLLTNMRFLVLSLAMGPDDACWLESYDNMRDLVCFSKKDGTIRLLSTGLPYAYNLFADGNDLLWVNGGASGGVERATIGPRTVTPASLEKMLNTPTSVAADADGLYWSEDHGAGRGVVMAADRSGTSPRMLATGLTSPRSVKPFGDYVYIAEAGRLQRAHKDGSGVEVVADGEHEVIDLAVDAKGVYWLAAGAPPNYLDGEVVRADLDGKHRTTIASDQHYLSALAMDADAIYWTLEGTETANYLDGALWRANR